MGRRTALVERHPIVGGAALNSGTIASKTFREAVIDFQAGRGDQLGEGGINQLLNRVDRVVKRESEIVQDQLRRNGVALIQGEAVFSDAHTACVMSEANWRTVTAANVP